MDRFYDCLHLIKLLEQDPARRRRYELYALDIMLDARTEVPEGNIEPAFLALTVPEQEEYMRDMAAAIAPAIMRAVIVTSIFDMESVEDWKKRRGAA